MFTSTLKKVSEIKPTMTLEQALASGTDAGVGSAVKLVFQPMARNSVQLRIQNLEDTFDESA